MDKGKVIRLILIPVIIGLAVTLVVRELLKTTKSPAASAPIQMVSVVTVAGKELIPARTKLTEAQLALKQVPKAVLTGAEFTSVRDVVGQNTVIELAPGEVILPNRLVPDGQGPLPFRIPSGTRAITIRIDELNGVAGYPEPGDLVDLVLTVAAKLPDRPLANSRILQEAVPVLAKGPAPSTGGSVAKGTTDGPKITSLTVALRPDAAVEVALAEQIGVIKVLLRPAIKESNTGRITATEGLYK